MINTPIDLMHQRIVLGTSASGEVAIRRARETATPLVVWVDGRIQEISAEEASRQREERIAGGFIEKNR